MREIKFRGNAVEEMIGSQLVYGTGIHITDFTDEYAAEHGTKREYFICTDSGWVEVHGHSICQYTGLDDKNDIEIYEGDEVENKKGNWKGKIVYQNGAFRVARSIDNKDKYWVLEKQRAEKVEIIQ